MYPYIWTYIYNWLFYVRDPAFKFIDRVAINASIADSIMWIRLSKSIQYLPLRSSFIAKTNTQADHQVIV